MPDYPILAKPRITAAGFKSVLTANGSPSAPESAACYKAFVDAGVDPAVGLAIFRKESTFGKYGRAKPNRSWGNIRGGSHFHLDDKHFRQYPSWTAGAKDAAQLLVVYGHDQIKPGKKTSTVQTFPFVWAPSSDGNAPDAYGDKLARWIGEWRRTYMPAWGPDVSAEIRALDPKAMKVAAAIGKSGHHYGSVIDPSDLAVALTRAGHDFRTVVDPSDVEWLLAWAAKH
jgi:hypothetical protein